jgi:hypothetical protein
LEGISIGGHQQSAAGGSRVLFDTVTRRVGGWRDRVIATAGSGTAADVFDAAAAGAAGDCYGDRRCQHCDGVLERIGEFGRGTERGDIDRDGGETDAAVSSSAGGPDHLAGNRAGHDSIDFEWHRDASFSHRSLLQPDFRRCRDDHHEGRIGGGYRCDDSVGRGESFEFGAGGVFILDWDSGDSWVAASGGTTLDLCLGENSAGVSGGRREVVDDGGDDEAIRSGAGGWVDAAGAYDQLDRGFFGADRGVIWAGLSGGVDIYFIEPVGEGVCAGDSGWVKGEAAKRSGG